jgi:hypothetical protein
MFNKAQKILDRMNLRNKRIREKKARDQEFDDTAPLEGIEGLDEEPEEREFLEDEES